MGELVKQDAPPVRPRRLRRILIPSAVALVVLAGIGTYVPIVLLAPLAPATGSAEAPAVAVPDPVSFVVPTTGSSAVSVTGAERFPETAGVGGILASGGTTDPRPIASVTKLVTALVILDAYPIGAGEDGPTLTFSRADSKVYDTYYLLGATITPMKAGSSMTLHDALETMLVVSATNYADVVSTWAFGSASGFRSAAADWLAANGLVSTTVVESTGVDPQNMSTPTDLIALARIALANPVVAEIVHAQYLDVPGLSPQPNTNTLLGTHGVTGLKTGTSEEAGACLLYSAVIDVGLDAPITVIGAVLGGNDRSSVANDVVRLLDSITAGFHQVPVALRGDVVGRYTTAWGDDAEIVIGKGATLLTWSDMAVTSTVEISSLILGDDGDVVGSATFTAGDETVTVPLELDATIEEPDAWWRITHPGG